MAKTGHFSKNAFQYSLHKEIQCGVVSVAMQQVWQSATRKSILSRNIRSTSQQGHLSPQLGSVHSLAQDLGGLTTFAGLGQCRKYGYSSLFQGIFVANFTTNSLFLLRNVAIAKVIGAGWPPASRVLRRGIPFEQNDVNYNGDNEILSFLVWLLSPEE